MSLSSSSGFVYIKSRIRAAWWRRHQGRSAAAFVGYQSLYPAFRYAVTPSINNLSWGGQADGGSVTRADAVSTYDHTYGNLGVRDYSLFTPAPSHTSTHTVPQQYHASPQSASVGARDYPPPSHPPPLSYQSQQQPLPVIPNANAAQATRSLPLSPAVVTAGEVATRFLEAINKAVNICIELNTI